MSMIIVSDHYYRYPLSSYCITTPKHILFYCSSSLSVLGAMQTPTSEAEVVQELWQIIE